MSEARIHEQAARYETAIRRFQEHIKRADDGTFLLDVADGKDIDVDPVIFEDLRRSLMVTNGKIRRGEIDPKAVEFMP